MMPSVFREHQLFRLAFDLLEKGSTLFCGFEGSLCVLEADRDKEACTVGPRSGPLILSLPLSFLRLSSSVLFWFSQTVAIRLGGKHMVCHRIG